MLAFVPDAALPLYTVLVPLFREAGVVPHLLGALARIDYPRDKLEVLLIVESIDAETQAALRDAEARAPHARSRRTRRDAAHQAARLSVRAAICARRLRRRL